MSCLICQRIKMIQNGTNPYFELKEMVARLSNELDRLIPLG